MRICDNCSVDTEEYDSSFLTSDVILGELEEQSIASTQDKINRFSLPYITPASEIEPTAFENKESTYICVSHRGGVTTNQPREIFFELLSQELRRSLTHNIMVKTTNPYVDVAIPINMRLNYQQGRYPQVLWGSRGSVIQIVQKLDNLEGLAAKTAVAHFHFQEILTNIAPEVIIKAEVENLTEDLEKSVRFAKDSYTTLKKIDANIECDPEIEGQETIRFTLTVSGEPKTVLEDEAIFKRFLRSNITKTARRLITVTYKWES